MGKPAQYILLEPALYIKKYERTLIYYKRLCIRHFSMSSFYNFLFLGSSSADSFRAKIPDKLNVMLEILQVPTNLKIALDSTRIFNISFTFGFFISKQAYRKCQKSLRNFDKGAFFVVFGVINDLACHAVLLKEL